MATLRETVDFYVDLLAFQFRQGPKARAQIAIYVKQALGDMLAGEIGPAFDLQTAVGVQLDVLGKYIGVPRTIGDPIDRPYYNFSDSDGTIRPNGFQDSTNPAQNAQAIWFQSGFLGTNNTALSDVAYKLVLQLQIILNANDSTLASIQEYLHTFLPGMVALTDNANMTLTYTLSQRIPITPGVLAQFLPKPMGVGLILVTLTAVAAPATLSRTITTTDPLVTVTTLAPSVVTVTNGVGPYNYLWELISGDSLIILTPLDPSTNFQMFLVPNPTDRTGVFQCTVTDSRGLVALSNPVTVHLIVQEPP